MFFIFPPSVRVIGNSIFVFSCSVYDYSQVYVLLTLGNYQIYQLFIDMFSK